MKTILHLTPQDRGRRLTLEEFTSASGQEGYHYELINGRLEVSPLPDLPHERLRKWLEGLLDEYAVGHAEVINHVQAPSRVFLPEREEVTAPEPDVAAFHDFPTDMPEEEVHWQDISPMVVAEIVSPDNADKDLVRNLPLYLAVPSIREYWVIDPRESYRRPALTVHRKRGQRWQRPIEVAGGGTYTTRLLPGFVLVLDRRAGQAEEGTGE